MKTAILTGASSGLGKEYLTELVRQFPEVEQIVLIARRKDRLDALAAQLRHEARAVGPYSALLPAIELLERHPERPVPVGELASMCYLSESNFRRKFIACMGCAPVTYRNRLRVQKAEELLQSGLYTVESAAELLGFTDGAHLCKARAAYHIDKGEA